MTGPTEIVLRNSPNRSPRLRALALPSDRTWIADATKSFDDFRRRVKIAAVGATFLLWEMPLDK